MNCRDLDEYLIGQQDVSGFPAVVREHLSVCERCRPLAGMMRVLELQATPRPSVLNAIEQLLTADLRPVRVLSTSWTFAALILSFTVCLAFSVYRVGPIGLAVMGFVQATVILGLLTTGAGLLCHSLVLQIAPGSRHKVSPTLLPSLVLLALATAVVVLFRTEPQPSLLHNAWTCFKAGLPTGIVAGLPIALVMRRGCWLSPITTATAAGFFGGLAGTMLLELHCPNLNAWHILLGHLTVAVAGAAVGLIAGVILEYATPRR